MKREAIRNEHEKTGLNHKEIVIVDDAVKIKLSPAQSRIVDTLKAATDCSHLRGVLKGFPGAGNPTTAECGSNGTASVHFSSSTVNSLLLLVQKRSQVRK